MKVSFEAMTIKASLRIYKHETQISVVMCTLQKLKKEAYSSFDTMNPH